MNQVIDQWTLETDCLSIDTTVHSDHTHTVCDVVGFTRDGSRCQEALQLQDVCNVGCTTQVNRLSILGDHVCLIVIIDRNRTSDGIA